MKILSYNVYGVKDTIKPIPTWNERQINIKRILTDLLKDNEIMVCCFQEVNEHNIDLLENILIKNNFRIVDKFPMKTQSYPQYNIVAIKNEKNISLIDVYCLPHGKDTEYKKINEQIIDYGMSDYRTTVFVSFEYNNKKYIIGNIHTDYISTEGKVKGVVKTLNYMDNIDADYKIVLGDMNMISHMSEVYNILKQNNNYTTLSRNKDFNIDDNSWHGYGWKEQVNVDFAFVEKRMLDLYDYQIVKQGNMMQEGSDHRPILVSIKDKNIHRKGIVICGLNGSGKSTFGKCLAQNIGYEFIDIEDCYFSKNDNKKFVYDNPRTKEEAEQILFDKVNKNINFVLSSVTGDYQKEIVTLYQCAIVMKVSKEVRIKRVKKRSFQKFGEQILPGGKLYEKEKLFFEYVDSREESEVTDWLKKLNCPVIVIDGTKSIEENIDVVVKELKNKNII